jgi:DNA uptake protein ComE-like DNA-binding protein
MTARLQADLSSFVCMEEVNEHVCINRKKDVFRNISNPQEGHTNAKDKESRKSKFTKKINRTIDKRESMNINQSTKEQLIALPGLAEVLSARIIKFRDRLGGFYSIDQLGDVYGIPEETLDRLEAFLTCDGHVSKIDLINDQFKKILQHPYLDYEQVKGIKNYIRKHGPIDSIEALMLATSKEKIDAQKLWPYISAPVLLANPTP